MFQLYTMTTIPSGSIANYYCPLNHNSPIAPLNVRGWAIVIVWISPLYCIYVSSGGCPKHTLLLPFVIYYFCGENKDNNLS